MMHVTKKHRYDGAPQAFGMPGQILKVGVLLGEIQKSLSAGRRHLGPDVKQYGRTTLILYGLKHRVH